MGPRMHCAECRATGLADTLLEGSDGLELAGWLLGGVPGWLYCAWRHAMRIKVCAACGSPQLVRESRAAAARRPDPAPPRWGPRVTSRSGPSRWPRALREPRRRLRRGLPWLGAWGLAALGLTGAGLLLGAAWLVREGLGELRLHFGARACRAWDAQGRALRIELA